MQDVTKEENRRRRSFIGAVFRRVFFHLLQGIRSLATPKGILALIPIVISVFAYVKASYQPTTIRMIVSTPIQVVRSVMTSGENKGGADYYIPSFEAFITSDGSEPVFLYRLVMNIVAREPGGTFQPNCDYWFPDPKNPSSSEIRQHMRLGYSVLNKTYAYDLKDGLVSMPNSVLPVKIEPTEDIDPDGTAYLSAGLGATRVGLTADHAINIYERDKKPDLEICFAGQAFSAGVPRVDFRWDSMSGDRVFTSTNERTFGQLPHVPDTAAVPAKKITTYTVSGGVLYSGIELVRFSRLNLF
ncbi:hypothetical protein [Shinella sp.]|uniref:hypothetical protein n=1 Tax=Shinella sp. TaxID=1870904 RepID=UPI004036533D